MKPKDRSNQMEIFERQLEGLLSEKHSLIKLSKQIDWEVFDELLGASYHPSQGAPGVNTRLMVSLHYLKYLHDLSDEAVLENWVENPYWQYFSGETYYQHELPIDPSSMSRWRKRLGQAGAQEMLKQTIETGIRMKKIKPTQMKRINVDTTVQNKAIGYPTDSRLYNRARETLVKAARKQGIKIKQSYQRKGPRLLIQQSRYAHARQMKRSAACTRKLRTYLGQIIRQIERQNPQGKLCEQLAIAKAIHTQQRHDKHKIYSMHEPQVHCIAKGKAGKKYEYGNKVSVAVSSQGGWLLGCQSHPGNPYDGHTLAAQLEQVQGLVPDKVHEAYTDMGYRGHNYQGAIIVHVDKRRRASLPKRIWKWMKRRAAVEPTIGHCKSDHRLDNNRLKGALGDTINALLSAAAMNMQKLLNALLLLIIQGLLRLSWKTHSSFLPIPA